MMQARVPLVITALLAALLIRCSSAPTVAGGSSTETTNGFVATITYPNGAPAAHAVVRVRPRNYLADTSTAFLKALASRDDILTDDVGRFAVDSLDTGAFLIEATDANGNAVAIPCAAIADSVIDLGSQILVPTGTIAGSVGGPAVHAFVRVRGLERSVVTGGDGRFDIKVPAGQSYAVNLAASDTTTEVSLSGSIQSTQTQLLNVDFGNYRSDSLAVRAFLDSCGLNALPVDSVTREDSSPRRISALHLAHRSFSEVHRSIGHLVFLNELAVSNCPVTDLPSTLADLPHLYHLYIDSLPLTKLPDCVPRILSLRLLQVDYTQITTLPATLSNCPDLNVISMRGTGATEFPVVVTSMPRMATINISDNPISVLPSSISACVNLDHFEIHNTLIDSLPASIGELTKLTNIFAYSCRLTSLPASIGRLTSLSVLNVGGNRLTSLPQEIGACVSLKYLNIDNNTLTTLPDSIVNLTPLSSLTVGSNKLCTVPSAIASWLDTYAGAGWSASQTCP